VGQYFGDLLAQHPSLAALAGLALWAAALVIGWQGARLSRKKDEDSTAHRRQHESIDKGLSIMTASLEATLARVEALGKDISEQGQVNVHLEKRLEGLTAFWHQRYDAQQERIDKQRQEIHADFATFTAELRGELKEDRDSLRESFEEFRRAMERQQQQCFINFEKLFHDEGVKR